MIYHLFVILLVLIIHNELCAHKCGNKNSQKHHTHRHMLAFVCEIYGDIQNIQNQCLKAHYEAHTAQLSGESEGIGVVILLKTGQKGKVLVLDHAFEGQTKNQGHQGGV